jgi:hypothetical protein
LWFVNVGMDRVDHEAFDTAGRGYTRHWEHCVKYGYVAAGGGRRYSDSLKKLEVGAPIVAYQKGAGYVGYGIVVRAAQPIHEFELPNARALEDESQRHWVDRPDENWEYAVAVDWKKWYDLGNARTFRGVFANQNIVCKLREPNTVQFVRKEFAIPEITD